MMDANVLGRPIPFSSSVRVNDASVNRAGGCVVWLFGLIDVGYRDIVREALKSKKQVLSLDSPLARGARVRKNGLTMYKDQR